MSGDIYKELRERVNQFVFENIPDKVAICHARELVDYICAKLDPFNWSTTPPPPVPSELTDFGKHTTTIPPVPPKPVPEPPDYPEVEDGMSHAGLDAPGPREKKM